MPQQTYSLDTGRALPGQPVDPRVKVGKYAASEDIPAGRMVALHTDGTLRLYRSGDKMLGISIYRSSKDPGTYVAGDLVPVLREGSIYAEFIGTAATDLVTANISGSTTIATDRGKLTDAAVSAVAGTEVVTGASKTVFYSAKSDCLEVGSSVARVVALIEITLTGKN